MNRETSDPSHSKRARRWWLLLLPGLLAIGHDSTVGQSRPQNGPMEWVSPTSLFDTRLDPLRRASTIWEARQGPTRTVVDQVCLVPDLPTFLEAVAHWDRFHYFPVLFDDVESTARFLRAFRPARIIRVPKVPSTGDRSSWDRAVAAVGASWKETAGAVAGMGRANPPGNEVPKGLGPTPPGVVISSPRASMLAGAVALAAGRFQPLLRLDYPRRYSDILDLDEFQDFDKQVATTVASAVPEFEHLGDGCDFVTIAGDWPYRYKDARSEVEATDDGLCRAKASDRRWAFAGRLMGDPTESTYRAMCSLFLQPESATMFNGYDETTSPWSSYSMRIAATRLSAFLPTTHLFGQAMANVEGWHETFDPWNKFGLILINSHGSPTVFNMRGDPATTADVPRTVPTAVVMIHSFSASDPSDPSTIAGRWLSNGAFVYFGSMNEPYLQAFRNPRLVGDLIGERLPLVAAVRSLDFEPFGRPWRLVYLGDPLYRLRSRLQLEPRVATWEPTQNWPAYVEPPRPDHGSDFSLLDWALKTSLSRAQSGQTPATDDLAEVLLMINRRSLRAPFQGIFDALIADVLFHANRRSELRGWIAAVPVEERSPSLQRWFETLLLIDLPLAVSRDDFPRARTLWAALIATKVPIESKKHATGLVARLATTLARRQDWADLLRAKLRSHVGLADAEIIGGELRRVEEGLRPARSR